MKQRRWLLYLLLLLVSAASGCDSSGDRVLVAKFLYDSHLTPPSRYDVVVFKYPYAPVENGTPKNYIKRLLGLPGEIIAIFFGRLYRFASPEGVPSGVSQKEWQDLTATGGVDPLELWKSPPKDHETAQKLWNQKQFEILRKPPAVMLALSRPVFDNDHLAADLVGVLPERWAPQGGAGWTPDSPNGFASAGSAGGEQWLRYRHILRPPDWPPTHIGEPDETSTKAGRKLMTNPHYNSKVAEIKGRKHWPQLITDFLGYNTYETSNHPMPALNWAGDLMLECKLTVTEAKGEFWMEVSRGVDRFQARFNLQTGVCTLYRLTREGNALRPIEIDKAETRVKGPGEYTLRFANYDERLTVWVNRDLPFEDGKAYQLPPDHPVGPDTEQDSVAEKSGNLDDIRNNDLQPASLCSVGAAVKVHAIKLWRDTYYTGNFKGDEPTADHERSALHDKMMNPNNWQHAKATSIAGDDWKTPSAWGLLRKSMVRTIYVYPGHYLCLGDNSPESSDSRFWGLVPDRLLLGRALLVYFPLNRAGRIK